ncbi:LysR family transcriptional regulator [Marinobacterium sediminicola]|uniref:DNA-binding transcriptional regulator, LysR family n=1 Tax=Marinobacterium sediminicola TaxID=518898 RepID=A0ABY1RVK3_9GAMM|nr:LysR family transcriptional regulator [Marinobacterium sediminicola]ULG70625.1 LysR family transcriptional regulator [Marinobacterium sediminicola]SMR68832.1 DNA-binding transcriptional regulator, LysR family [Marinobacterium sediminicola]
MDTAGLHAFVTVADTGSFSQAAQLLFLTQSAVSKRIALLESQLECRLFDRIGRQVLLTEPGQALLPKARDILASMEDAERMLGNLSGRVGGRLALAASHHISLHRLPPLLKRFVESYPDVDLDLQFAASEVAYEGVLRGDLELALITLAPEQDERICARTVWSDRLQYVVGRNHPLATNRRLDLTELNRYPAILPGPDTFTHQRVRQQLAGQGLELNLGMSTDYLDTIRMMVSIGLGWSLLPETMIDDQLVRLNTGTEPIVRPLGYIYHRDRTLSNAARELTRLLETSV